MILKVLNLWLNKKSLGVRYTLGLVITSVLVLFISGVSFLLLFYFTSKSAYLSTVNSSTHSLISNVLPAVIFKDKKSADETLRYAMETQPFIRGGCIILSDGEDFSSYFKTGEKIDCSNRAILNKSVNVIHSPLDPSEDIGSLFIFTDLSQLDQTLWLYFTIALLIFGFSILISIFIAGIMKKPFLGAIHDLIDFVRNIVSKNNFEGNISKLHDDEIGVLTDEFNYMIRMIRDREKSLKENQNVLEKKVKERTKDLETAKENAEKANAFKSDFLANMSHEIRTPMNAILGFTQILLKKENNPEDKHYLNTISKNGETLLALINEILDLSKVEAGKMKIEYRPGSLNAIMHDMSSTFAVKISDQVAMFIETDELLPEYLWIDDMRLRQILINLIGNAFKFTENGYVKIRSGFLNNNNDGTVDLELSVEDTGIGIPENMKETIFEAFTQKEGQDINKYGGTGLGLAITKQLVGLMNGELLLESQPEKGSTFKVVLRNVRIATGEDIISDSLDPLDLDEFEWKGEKILVVDDVEANRQVIQAFLKHLNLEILEAENGKEAVEIAKKEKPDFIFMDIKMPVMNGETAIKILSEDPETAKIPVAVITASLLNFQVEKVRERCVEVIKKPVNLVLLRNVLVATLKPMKIKPTSMEEESAQIKKDMDNNQLENYLRENITPVMEKVKSDYDLMLIKNMLLLIEKEVQTDNVAFNGWKEEIKKGIRNFDNEKIDSSIKTYFKITNGSLS